MIVRVILWMLSVLMMNIASAGAQPVPEPFVDRLVIDGTINPAVAEFVHERIGAAHHDGARALVIKLDTLGGLLESTRSIVKDILGSPVPVLVYVSPSGATAGSAGVFISERNWRGDRTDRPGRESPGPRRTVDSGECEATGGW